MARSERDFAAAWRARGLSGEELEMSGVNHFALRRHFSDPDSPILKAMLKLMSL